MGAARQNTANLLDVRSYHFMAAAFKAEVVQSYRSISKQALRTICYAAPARYTLRAVINNAYRFGNAADFDQRKIDKTLDFLRYAAAENALEHHIVKTLIHTWFHDGDIKRVHSMCVLSTSVLARFKYLHILVRNQGAPNISK